MDQGGRKKKKQKKKILQPVPVRRYTFPVQRVWTASSLAVCLAGMQLASPCKQGERTLLSRSLSRRPMRRPDARRSPRLGHATLIQAITLVIFLVGFSAPKKNI